MNVRYRGFARFASSKTDSSVRVPIRVSDMNAGDAFWWDTRFGAVHARDASRADRLWSWTTLLPACHLTQLAQRRFCRPLVIWARADNGRFLRVGMSIMIERYPHLDQRDLSDSHFVWFISAADTSVLKARYGMSHPPSLMRVHLDNAMVLSFHAGFEGRIGLHAAASGGTSLFQMYLKYLQNLDASAVLPSQVRRRNDGRFFFANPTIANLLMQKLDLDR